MLFALLIKKNSLSLFNSQREYVIIDLQIVMQIWSIEHINHARCANK